MSSKRALKGEHPIRSVERGYRSAIFPINYEDQKRRFLLEGKPPEFVLSGSSEEVRKITSREKAMVRFEHLEIAERILNIVRHDFGDGNNFLDVTYGPEISKEQATKAVMDYIYDNNLEGSMSITWCTELACSATMMWQGPSVKLNKPEARRYSLWLNDSRSNTFLREKGITSLMHHEIGTHYFRMHNDGLQPWFSDRKRFGLMPTGCRKVVATEEGLASIHTVMDSRVKYLWTAALLYYAACKAEDMSFRELFDHLEQFIADKEQRWKHCIRVKRGQDNVNIPGGYGKDQCYLEGAIKLLKDVEGIDFVVLMAGKICKDEVERCKRLARTDIIKLPHFILDMERYKRTLRHIAQLNGIGPVILTKSPNASKKVQCQNKKSKPSVKNIPRLTVSAKNVSEPRSVTDRPPSLRCVTCNDAWHKKKQQYRFTHTPTDLGKPLSPPLLEDKQRSVVVQDGQHITKFIYTRNSAIGVFSTNNRSNPASPEPKSKRAQSVCSTNVDPEIKHYSQRMLQRKRFRHPTPTPKKKRKAVKSP